MKILLKVFFILLLAFYVVSCENISREEISRITSPDVLVDAVLVRVNAGATTPYAYKLYIVPLGGLPKKNQELFVADNIVGIKIQWKQAKLLEIQYEKGRIFHFTNFWSSKEIENFRYVVELRLVPSAQPFPAEQKR